MTTTIDKPPRTRTRRPVGSGRRGRRGHNSRAAYIFLAPLLVIFALFYLWPALQSVLSSFFRWGLLRPWKIQDSATWHFVGLDNYRQTLSDADFANATTNSVLWLIVFPVLVTVVSLAMAISIWHTRRWAAVFRTIFVLPMTISLAAAGVIWTFIYNPDPDVGVLNAVLHALHLSGDLNIGPLHLRSGQWLADAGSLNLGFTQIKLVNLMVMIPAVWAFSGFGVVTFTAGLSSLPGELVDSAKVDGCGTWQLVRNVIIPHLRQPMMIVVVVSVIFALRTFDIVYVMTGGGPGKDSMVLGVLVWQQAFAFLSSPKAGAAVAIAVLMSVALIVLAFPYLKAMLRRESR